MAYGMAGMPGNRYKAGLPRGMGGFPAVGGGLGGLPVRVTTPAGNYISKPTPTPAAFGDALEGGYYAGMVWQEICTTSDSKLIGSGLQSFEVSVDMSATPLFYAGQQIEVRSRADPNNRFQGTVSLARKTTLTVSVSGVTGSGTFSDWSVMARYRVIVAPKATGEESSGFGMKNANTAFPAACQTLTDGWAATEAMRLDGNSTVYPLVHWARGLNIGGYTDWYIPARDELEIVYRNLKPSATNNTIANRGSAASFSYTNKGAFGDNPSTHGTNNNSSPTGAAYTTSDPAQTANVLFQSGGAQQIHISQYIASSTDYNTTQFYAQYFPGGDGRQILNTKNAQAYARAVRRSII